jgi:hypothetical protein
MAEGQPQAMTVRWLVTGLALLFSCGVALPDDMTGQASVIDGDTLEIHGTRIRLWGIDASFAAAKTASNTDAALRQRMIWMRSSPVGR